MPVRGRYTVRTIPDPFLAGEIGKRVVETIRTFPQVEESGNLTLASTERKELDVMMSDNGMRISSDVAVVKTLPSFTKMG